MDKRKLHGMAEGTAEELMTVLVHLVQRNLNKAGEVMQDDTDNIDTDALADFSMRTVKEAAIDIVKIFRAAAEEVAND